MPEATPLVICGLDGVLALIEHRLHHLYNEEGERDWARFHAACIDDMPNLALIDRLNLAHREGIPVLLLSGRSAAARAQTEQWLRQWQITYDGLWLRPPGEYRPSEQFKVAILEQHYPGQPIRRVYESSRNLAMARWCEQQGIPCTLIGPNQGNGEGRELFELKVIAHTCGHSSLYPFYGDDDFAWEERAAQLREGPCPLCAAKEQEAEQHKRSLQARFQAEQRGLPPLEGSEKQCAWAETIRQSAFGAIDKVQKWIAQVEPEAVREDPDHWSTVKQGIGKATAFLEAQVEAKWWVDHRHGIRNDLDSGRALLSAIAEQQGFF